MTLNCRAIYDAHKDALKRWPRWTFRRANLETSSIVILTESEVVLLDNNGDHRTNAAEAVAHLDLGHHNHEGWLTPDQQTLAEMLAKMRIDDTDSDAGSVDGERTIQF